MTPEAAAAVLGLEDATHSSSEQLKRAYLRAVRAHPPERDPEGFQRVREAYEFLQPFTHLLDLRAARIETAARAEVPLEAKTPSAEPVASNEAEPQSVPVATAVSTEEPPELDAPDAPHFALLHRALNAEDPERAGELLVEYLRTPALDFTPMLPVAPCLHTALALFSRGNVALARALLSAFESCVKRDDSSAREMGPAYAARWVILKELSELSQLGDPRVALYLAQALESGSLKAAVPRIERLLRSRPLLQHELNALAPSIWAGLQPLLRFRVPLASRGNGSSRFLWGVPWLFVVVLMRLCSGSTGSSNSNGYTPPTQVQTDYSGGHALRALADSEVMLQDAIDRYDCPAVARQWDVYTMALKSSDLPDERRRAARDYQARAAAACPQLNLQHSEQP